MPCLTLSFPISLHSQKYEEEEAKQGLTLRKVVNMVMMTNRLHGSGGDTTTRSSSSVLSTEGSS